MTEEQIRALEAVRCPGPCIVCGAENYGLSCGGPTICPKCDCGHFDQATVYSQSKWIERLQKENESLKSEREAPRKALEAAQEHLKAFYATAPTAPFTGSGHIHAAAFTIAAALSAATEE